MILYHANWHQQMVTIDQKQKREFEQDSYFTQKQVGALQQK